MLPREDSSLPLSPSYFLRNSSPWFARSLRALSSLLCPREIPQSTQADSKEICEPPCSFCHVYVDKERINKKSKGGTERTRSHIKANIAGGKNQSFPLSRSSRVAKLDDGIHDDRGGEKSFSRVYFRHRNFL